MGRTVYTLFTQYRKIVKKLVFTDGQIEMLVVMIKAPFHEKSNLIQSVAFQYLLNLTLGSNIPLQMRPVAQTFWEILLPLMQLGLELFCVPLHAEY